MCIRDSIARLRQLAFTTIDEHDIRQASALFSRALIAPGQRLMQRGVIIARRDALDVIAPISGLERPFPIEHHTRRDRRLALGMTCLLYTSRCV